MEHEEELEKEIPVEIHGEETSEEKEAAKPEKEKEAEGRVIEIHAPPPFDEEALNPFIDVFMAKRGLADRKQAAVKLANVLARMGYDPRKDIQNVTTYINNLSTVLSAVPDTPETMPVKGALMARGAVDTAGMIGRSHFGERDMSGVDPELKQMLKFAQNAKVTMKILDSAFAGDSNSDSSSEVKELKGRLARLEGDKALDAKLAPLHTEIRSLQQNVQDLLTRKPTKKPDEESAAMKDVKNILGAMGKQLDALDQRYKFSTEIQGIKNEFQSLKTIVEKGGGTGDVTDVFDKTIKLMDKMKEAMMKYGGEGEFDWRVAGITSATEVATEAIKTFREISTKGAEGTEAETQAKTGKISEKIIDRRLLSYIQQKASTGALDFNSAESAKALGVTEKDILTSYQRLRAKGILRNVGETGGKTEKTKSAEPEQTWVEG